MFKNARLKLTILYVLLVGIIVFGFSVFLYQQVGRNLQDASDDDFAGHDSHQHFVANTLDSLQYELIVADVIILITSAGLSYALAGKTLEPIQKSVEAQKEFAANASHELRTPLAVMKNDIEVFLRNREPVYELAAKTIKSNLEEVDRMTKMVENLLMIARSDNGSKYEMKKVDMGPLLSSIVEKIRPLAENKNIKLSLDQKNEHLVVMGDVLSLERVALNIIQNSIEHTMKGGSITIYSVKEYSNLIIKISDDGVGIEEKDLAHVFKRFYKSESSSGTGLGLSIVREIIKEHNGTIAIESKKGKGTQVIIKIPIT